MSGNTIEWAFVPRQSFKGSHAFNPQSGLTVLMHTMNKSCSYMSATCVYISIHSGLLFQQLLEQMNLFHWLTAYSWIIMHVRQIESPRWFSTLSNQIAGYEVCCSFPPDVYTFGQGVLSRKNRTFWNRGLNVDCGFRVLLLSRLVKCKTWKHCAYGRSTRNTKECTTQMNRARQAMKSPGIF